MRSLSRHALVLLCVVAPACQSDDPEGNQYFDRVIRPILSASCEQGTSPCHRADAADPFAFAAGNLDVTTFENIKKRPDVLRQYGAYPVPFLLLKAVGPTDDLSISYRDQFVTSQIPHAGGNTLQVGSPAYLTLSTWLQNGATRDGLPPEPAPVEGEGACSRAVPSDFAPSSVDPEFGTYGDAFDAVQTVISEKGCNAGSCHGAPQSDFYITCGDSEDEKRWNFSQVWSFVDTPVDDSEILERPLAIAAGGVSHSGGTHFPSREDAAYTTIKAFAEQVGARTFGEGDPGKTFFAENVQPILLRRGCASEGCHSPAAQNDFKLRAGTQGFFSAVALEKNYDLVKREFMALESPDVRRGRILSKNILPGSGGIAHRGGPLLETPGSGGTNPEACPATYDPAGSAYCTFREWHRIERAAMGSPNVGQVPLVYVQRGAGDLASPLDVGAYQPGADLRASDVAIDADGAVGAVTNDRSLLGACGIGDLGAVDVRGPDVAPDGDLVAFSMRTAAGVMQLWTVSLSTGTCAPVAGQDTAANNVDPAFAPDGSGTIVYASTAAGGTSRRLSLPQLDLWRLPVGGTPERMTVLSNSELEPAFMRDGRVTMTTEKADPRDPTGGYYQLAGRRMNWDLTDYHPLLAQRAMSPVDPGNPSGAVNPSVGYAQATEIREGMDGDFLFVASQPGAKGGAGTLAIFNRSVGPFEKGRTDSGYLASVTFPDEAGTYRSPYPLPDGRVLAAYAAGADPTTATSLDWELVAVDPHTGARTVLVGGAGQQVEGVLALVVPSRSMYQNRRQLVFGGSTDPGDLEHAVVHLPDAPMLATLLGANLRRGRDPDAFRDASQVVVWSADGTTQLGTAPLASDGSVRFRAPAGVPIVLGLLRDGAELFRMTEEHQYGPGERISMGIPEHLFDNVCGGCHGSVSGRELDIAVRPDVLTGASQSASAAADPVPIGP